MGVARLAGLAMLVASTAAAGLQTAPPPRFDAVSIQPRDPASRLACFEKSDPVQYSAVNCPLIYWVAEAYEVESYRVVPPQDEAWITRDAYSIRATMSAPTDRDRRMAMLRTLLAERFGLRVHRGVREGDVYTLSVAPGGPKLKPAADPAHRAEFGYYREGDNRSPATSFRDAGTNVTMAEFAGRLTSQLRAPVEDKTGLAGGYDLAVNYTEVGQDPGLYPSLPLALEQQLGLKLTRGKGPVPVLIIDRAARPSAN